MNLTPTTEGRLQASFAARPKAEQERPASGAQDPTDRSDLTGDKAAPAVEANAAAPDLVVTEPAEAPPDRLIQEDPATAAPAAEPGLLQLIGGDSIIGGPKVSQARIDAILNIPDPVKRNVFVTQCYTDTAAAFRDCVGEEGGVNWCAWASWASQHVGVTIREEDFPWLKPAALVTAAVATVGAGLLAPGIGWLIGGGLGLAGVAKVFRSSKKGAKAISNGNDEIFLRTIPNYVRFVETFQHDTKPNPAKLEKFLDEIGPDGPSEKRGFTLLKKAFANYYEAKFETDPKKKQELVLLGNSQVVWDEQITAQTEMEEAMPFGSRHLLTKLWLSLPMPGKTIKLGEDVPPLPNGKMFPEGLEKIENRELQGVLDHFQVKDTTERSGARNYVDINQRMHFILNLFRSHHQDHSAYEPSHTPEQLDQIRSGLLPSGKLH